MNLYPQQKNDIAILESLDDEKLLEMSCALEDFRWPQELLEPELHFRKFSPRRDFIKQWLKNRLGQKTIVRAWHSHMNEEEFELFYSACWLHEPIAEKDYAEYERKQWEKRQVTPDHFGRLPKYYSDLALAKAEELGIPESQKVFSLGYWKRELFDSVEWVSTYDEKNVVSSVDEVLEWAKRYELKVVAVDLRPDEFRIWIETKNENICDPSFLSDEKKS